MKKTSLVFTSILVGALLVASNSFSESVLDRAKRDEIVMVPDEDPAMAAAFKKARATLDDFLALAKNPPPHLRTIAVKVGLSDKKETEYFWIVPFREESTGFAGQLNNEPRLVKTVKIGQEIRFTKKEIVDWMYVDTLKKKMEGNFTLCALLTRESRDEAAKMKKQMKIDCDS
jgi:uncharacterized protein YegJ (DUF2314 family)